MNMYEILSLLHNDGTFVFPSDIFPCQGHLATLIHVTITLSLSLSGGNFGRCSVWTLHIFHCLIWRQKRLQDVVILGPFTQAFCHLNKQWCGIEAQVCITIRHHKGCLTTSFHPQGIIQEVCFARQLPCQLKHFYCHWWWKLESTSPAAAVWHSSDVTVIISPRQSFV